MCKRGERSDTGKRSWTMVLLLGTNKEGGENNGDRLSGRRRHRVLAGTRATTSRRTFGAGVVVTSQGVSQKT